MKTVILFLAVLLILYSAFITIGTWLKRRFIRSLGDKPAPLLPQIKKIIFCKRQILDIYF